jgi:hypothetical protein
VFFNAPGHDRADRVCAKAWALRVNASGKSRDFTSDW